MVSFQPKTSIVSIVLVIVLSFFSTTTSAREHVPHRRATRGIRGGYGIDSRRFLNPRTRMRRRVEQDQKHHLNEGIYRGIGSVGTSPKQTKSSSYGSSETASTPFPADADSTEAPVGTELVENSASVNNNNTTVETDIPITEAPAGTDSPIAEVPADTDFSITEEPAETVTVDANSNSFVIETPSEIPIPNTEEAVDIVEDSISDNSNDEACLAVTAQEPPPLDSEEDKDIFAMTVDVLYQEASITPANISFYLDEKNIAMALWIVGCETGVTDTTTIETAEGKRRRILEDLSITYSQVDSWEVTGGLK